MKEVEFFYFYVLTYLLKKIVNFINFGDQNGILKFLISNKQINS